MNLSNGLSESSVCVWYFPVDGLLAFSHLLMAALYIGYNIPCYTKMIPVMNLALIYWHLVATFTSAHFHERCSHSSHKEKSRKRCCLISYSFTVTVLLKHTEHIYQKKFTLIELLRHSFSFLPYILWWLWRGSPSLFRTKNLEQVPWLLLLRDVISSCYCQQLWWIPSAQPRVPGACPAQASGHGCCFPVCRFN